MIDTKMNETGSFDMNAGKNEIIEAVSRVVAAFASRESASVNEVVDLASRLSGVFTLQLTVENGKHDSAVQPLTTEAHSASPAMAVEKSITNDTVYCLCCGRGFSMLKRHLKAEHGLTEQEYRARFSIPESIPLIAPSYSKRKAAYAKQVGLGKYRRDEADNDSANASG
jgi:predicted transcriptional regulator